VDKESLKYIIESLQDFHETENLNYRVSGDDSQRQHHSIKMDVYSTLIEIFSGLLEENE